MDDCVRHMKAGLPQGNLLLLRPVLGQRLGPRRDLADRHVIENSPNTYAAVHLLQEPTSCQVSGGTKETVCHCQLKLSFGGCPMNTKYCSEQTKTSEFQFQLLVSSWMPPISVYEYPDSNTH